jgi:hypothetical protein
MSIQAEARDGAGAPWRRLPSPPKNQGLGWWNGTRNHFLFGALGNARLAWYRDRTLSPVEQGLEEVFGDLAPIVEPSECRGMPADVSPEADYALVGTACSWLDGAELLRVEWERPVVRGRGYVSPGEFERWRRHGYVYESLALPVRDLEAAQEEWPWLRVVSNDEMAAMIDSGEVRMPPSGKLSRKWGHPLSEDRAPVATLVEWELPYGFLCGGFPRILHALLGRPANSPELAARYDAIFSGP